jgi:acyl-CoA thioester hydrolase
MDQKWIETYRGLVHPWLCDSQWHMSARNYASLFDDASWAVLSVIGYKASMANADKLGWAELKHVTEFKREAPLGAILVVESTIDRIGNSSLVIRHRLIDSEDDTDVARFEGVTVAFDLSARKSRPLPESMKQSAERIFAAPRSAPSRT